MSATPLISLLGIPVFLPQARQEETDFARLSPEAQELIVDAVLGVYDDAPPENIPESVREEIAKWCAFKPGKGAPRGRSVDSGIIDDYQTFDER